MEPAHTISFIIKATSLGFNISGLCFQVENQMNSNVQFLKALQSCKEIFDECAQIGIHLSVLDIGNGFPFSTSHNYEAMHSFFDPINTYLSTRFNGVELIAEPGNFISTPIASIICNVIGKSYRNEKICYYLNNGFCNNIKSLSKELNNFSEVIAYSKFRKSIGDEYVSLVYGSSDDSMDLILEDAYLPEINIGDQLFFDNVGSMGISYSNAFISAETNQIIYLDF
jgi:ornithine decarboxylase